MPVGKPVSSNVERVETTSISTKVNKEVFESFKNYCKRNGYQMNLMLEVFMLQYSNGRFILKSEDIVKYKDNNFEVETLSTTLNKEIYVNFKSVCGENGYYVRHVLTEFMEKFINEDFILEYTKG